MTLLELITGPDFLSDRNVDVESFSTPRIITPRVSGPDPRGARTSSRGSRSGRASMTTPTSSARYLVCHDSLRRVPAEDGGLAERMSV